MRSNNVVYFIFYDFDQVKQQGKPATKKESLDLKSFFYLKTFRNRKKRFEMSITSFYASFVLFGCYVTFKRLTCNSLQNSRLIFLAAGLSEVGGGHVCTHDHCTIFLLEQIENTFYKFRFDSGVKFCIQQTLQLKN